MTNSLPEPRGERVEQLVAQLSTVYRTMTICAEDLTLNQQSLPARQQAIVFLLAEHRGGLFVKELSAAMAVTSSAITQLVDILVEKKLVERSEDEINRRMQRITLTTAAAQGFSKLHNEYLAQVAPVFKNLIDTEIEQLIGLLTIANGAIKN